MLHGSWRSGLGVVKGPTNVPPLKDRSLARPGPICFAPRASYGLTWGRAALEPLGAAAVECSHCA